MAQGLRHGHRATEPVERAAAVLGLGLAGGGSAVDVRALQDAADDPDDEVAVVACHALAAMARNGADAEGRIAEWLFARARAATARATRRCAAIEALGVCLSEACSRPEATQAALRTRLLAGCDELCERARAEGHGAEWLMLDRRCDHAAHCRQQGRCRPLPVARRAREDR
jgi:hypothetical protein